MNEEQKKAADKKSLVETDGLAHRRLDVQRLHVLPVLLQQRDEEVDAYGAKDVSEWIDGGQWTVRTQHDVSKDLVVRHLNVTDSNTQAENLLQLVLDRRPDLVELVVEVLSVRDGSRELASYTEASATHDGL